jgi:hypothetical protein
MAEDPPTNPSSPLEPFFERLLARDPSGSTWLPQLLAAAPNGRERLGELVDQPGWLVTPMAVRTASGRLGCFEYPAIPARELLAWYIDHPDQLVWPADAELPRLTARLRRALLCDDPPGSQAKAQERAHELLAATRTLFGHEWWRFETVQTLDCVLITNRVVITVEGRRADAPAPATRWYPQRTQLVRDLEAARGLADGKQWASLVLSDQRSEDVSDESLTQSLPAAAPHLDAGGRDELHAAYLGNLTWREAGRAVGLALDPLLAG